MTDRTEIVARNKTHLVCDEVKPIPDSLYGYEKALAATGVEVLAYESFGSYQGVWWAKIKFSNGEVYFVTGYYGSCSGCDSFEGEFGWRDEEKPDYLHRLKDFGKDYLEDCLTTDQAIEHASRHIEWDHDAQAMVDWIRDNSITSQ